jgi:hypothetical protein
MVLAKAGSADPNRISPLVNMMLADGGNIQLSMQVGGSSLYLKIVLIVVHRVGS